MTTNFGVTQLARTRYAHLRPFYFYFDFVVGLLTQSAREGIQETKKRKRMSREREKSSRACASSVEL